MVLPGHIAGGYLATFAFLSLTNASSLPAEQINLLYAIGILSAEGPDMDIIFFYLECAKHKIYKTNHRDYITHAPIVWFLPAVIIIVCGIISSSPFVSSAGWIMLGGSFSHFVFDSIEYGIRWIWPFSNERFYLRDCGDQEIAGDGSFSHYWKYIISTYPKRWTFYAEILIVIAAVSVAI